MSKQTKSAKIVTDEAKPATATAVVEVKVKTEKKVKEVKAEEVKPVAATAVVVEEVKPVAAEPKKKAKKAAVVEEQKPAAVEETKPAVVEEVKPVAAEPKKKAKKAAVVEETKPAAVEGEKSPVAAEGEKPAKAGKKTVNVEEEFDKLNERLELLLKESEGEGKSKNSSKLLKTFSKDLKALKTDVLKSTVKKKKRTPSDPEKASNSGFMKKVQVTPDMNKFAGLSSGELMSRNDVTVAICDYIKKNNLQTEKDRRHFIPDEKLAHLLGSKESCTYDKLQRIIGPIFVKN